MDAPYKELVEAALAVTLARAALAEALLQHQVEGSSMSLAVVDALAAVEQVVLARLETARKNARAHWEGGGVRHA